MSRTPPLTMLLLVVVHVYRLLKLAPSPLPLSVHCYYFQMCSMCLPCLETLFLSLPFVSITLLMSYFLTLSFRCRIVTQGSLWFIGSVEMVSITGRSQSLFILLPYLYLLQFGPRFPLSPCGIIVSVIRLSQFFAYFLMF